MLKYLWFGWCLEIPAITGQRAEVIVKLCFLGQDAFLVNSGSLRTKVKRRLTLTFRNHRYKTTRKVQDDQLTNIVGNGRFGFRAVPSVLMSVHEKNSKICGS
jgi:hypothetical protein